MTDHNREAREALIQDVAKQISDASWRGFPDGKEFSRVYAEIALAAFEQAHAPTSDEREALANLIDDELQSQRIFDLRDIASAILAAGFRRTVQGEDQGPAAGCAYCVGAGGFEDHDGEWVKCSCQRAKPQGELMRGTFGHVWPCPLFYVGNWGKENQPLRECVGGYCATEQHGEPTDAQVNRVSLALDEDGWHGHEESLTWEDLDRIARVALRVAGEAKR